MKFSLNTTIINPENNDDVKNAIILLHGYGGDGKDISMLSLNWKRFLKNYILEVSDYFNLEYSKICVSGFSQGCMMSLNVGLTSEKEFGCIVGFSGKIIDKQDLSSRIKNKTDILMIHGENDTIVSPSYLLEAEDFFIRNKIKIETLMIKNCEHHIPIEASSAALNFIKKKLIS